MVIFCVERSYERQQVHYHERENIFSYNRTSSLKKTKMVLIFICLYTSLSVNMPWALSLLGLLVLLLLHRLLLLLRCFSVVRLTESHYIIAFCLWLSSTWLVKKEDRKGPCGSLSAILSHFRWLCCRCKCRLPNGPRTWAFLYVSSKYPQATWQRNV